MLSRFEILEEYAKCITDPKYAIETYLKTLDGTQGGLVPFILFPRQKEIIDCYEEHRYNLVSKPRQAGVSTTTAAYLAVKAAFGDMSNPEKILILANKQLLAQEFLGKVKAFLLQLPRWIWGDEYYGTPEKEKKAIFIANNKGQLVLPNNCEVKAVATSKDAIRGYSPSRLIIDEAGFVDNGAEVFTTAQSSLSTGGRCTLISTPNGQDELYYKTYESAKAGENNFHIVEMRWYEDLRYNKGLKWLKRVNEDLLTIDEIDFTFASYEAKLKDGYKPTSPWYSEMCRSMNNNARKIAQELDVSFLGSGGNVINDEYVKFHEDNYVTEPKFISGSNREYWVWEEPIEGHEYILASDAARGDGEDSSTIVIIDFTTMEQVMEYKGKVQPDLLGEIIYEYGNLYKALTVIDIAGGMGVPTVLKLLDMDYKYLHYDDPKSKLLINKKQLAKLSSKDSDKMPGFNATSCRVSMIANLERCVRENVIKIRSRRLTGEMKTFVYRNGRADHMSGFHDDLLMALAMGLFVLEHSFKNLQKLDKQTKVMLDSWVVGAGSGVNDASAFIAKSKTGMKTIIDPSKQQLAFRNTQDPKGEYLWLFSGMI